MLFGSLTFSILLLLFAELACRIFSDIHYLGNSRNLLVANAFGSSNGNAKNVEAVSFGMKVYTDRNGFRVPPGSQDEPVGSNSAILILGDSVAFGPAIAEEHTVSGQLRSSLPSTRIFNASVIGHRTHDYKNVVETILPGNEQIRRVFLIFCLNDILADSAKGIDEALGSTTDHKGGTNNTVESIGKISWVKKLNEFLRPRSKLYLLLRNTLTDSLTRHGNRLLQEYADPNFVYQTLQPSADIASMLEHRGIEFVVIISPVELQLRNGASDELTGPQQLLTEYFAAANVPYIDALPIFRSKDMPSTRFFLWCDTMHLSEYGHKVMHDIIMEFIAGDISDRGQSPSPDSIPPSAPNPLSRTR